MRLSLQFITFNELYSYRAFPVNLGNLYRQYPLVNVFGVDENDERERAHPHRLYALDVLKREER